MYSTKEKLSHFRSLLAPDLADADLQLLKEKDSGNSNLVRFSLAPAKNAEDILFALLDVCTHDEIVRNRRDFIKPAAPAQEIADVQSTSEQSQEPEIDSTSEGSSDQKKSE